MNLTLIVAASTVALTLGQAREQASERAAAVEQARYEAEAAQGDLRASAVDVLPSVSGFASVSTGAGLTSFGFERPVSTQVGIGLTGSWRLVSPSAWAASSAARRTASGADALAEWARIGARRDVTVAFAEALAAEGVAQALEEASADAERSLAAVSALVAAGIQPPADVDGARADALAYAARAAEARARVTATCARVEELIASDITGVCELEAEPWGEPAPRPDGYHPALVASAEALGAAEALARRAWAGHLPDAGVSATAAEYIIPGGGSGLGWQAGVDLKVPLTLATGGMGDVRAAKADVQRAQSQLTAQERALKVSLLSAEATWEAALKAREARQGAVSAAQAAFAETDGRYKAGLVGLTDWLASRRALIEARIALVSADASVGAALAEVEAARGLS